MPDRDPLTGVPPSRHPFQFWALAACMLGGLNSMFGEGAPGSLQEILPAYALYVWGITLFVGGALGIVSGWWRDRITGLLLERIALGAIAGITIIYALVVYKVAGGSASFIAMFMASMSIASTWRVRHINRELKILMRWIERHY